VSGSTSHRQPGSDFGSSVFRPFFAGIAFFYPIRMTI
jgi:hypothetical protein